jgi:eukaryotic-like serine/threonine-protein kinase
MAVSRERFREIDRVLDAALDIAPNARDDFIAMECGTDAELRDSVRTLLGAHQRASGFLEAPVHELAAELLAEPPAPPPAVARAGPFRIIRELGAGGMGIVYLAEREGAAFQQRVALKLVRHLGASAAMHRRFLDERRILALLEHPRIAHLIDGGLTSDGLPYFAMELVEGEPIDVYCDARGLSVEQRLDLVIDVSDAVQYAHEQLVIHRDLKPSNILVRADGQLKLLDFGIAKLLDPVAGNADAATYTGVLALTPEYAAPEQVRGEPVSTATDTYALGVLMYTLLCGRRPYDVRGRTPADLQRIICEIDPPKPSATIGLAGNAAQDEAAARARRTTPDRLRRRLRGDLDVIVAKALHKDPKRRYSSAAALRDDLERWRSGRPVRARPDSARYRLGKLIRRNRAGTAVVLLLAAYGVTSTVQGDRVRRALAEATLGTYRAERVTDFMLGLFEEAEAGQRLTDTVTAGALLTRGERRAAELSGEPAMQAQMWDVIGRLYMQLGHTDRAKVLLEQALATRERLYGKDHPDYVTSLEHLASVTDRTSDMKTAAERKREAWVARRKLSGDDDPKTLRALFGLSVALHRAGADSAAKPLLEQWLAAIARLPRESTPERATELSLAANTLAHRGPLDRAEPLLREALSIRRALYGERHHAVAVSLDDLGSFYDIDHRHELAEPLLRQSVEMLRPIYPDGSPQLARALRSWAVVLAHMRRHDEALPVNREVVQLHRRYFGDTSLDVAMSELDLSTSLSWTGDYLEAEAVARDAIRILGTLMGEKSAMVSRAKVTLGNALRGQRRFGEAEAMLLEAFRRFDPAKPMTRQWNRMAAGGLARLYTDQNRLAEAARYRALTDAPDTKD